MTYIVKNKGEQENFAPEKVLKSIIKAMKSGSGLVLPKIANVIVDDVVEKFGKKELIKSSDVDKFVLNKLVDYGQTLTAQAYERYKTAKYFQQQNDIIDNDISGVINGSNKSVLDENSNKNGEIISTQRDLIAGVLSRSYSERKILSTTLLNAHKEGLIHIHDTDYLIHPGCFNCCLINLKDIFLNGTVINGKMIETPKSLRTAATVASQISLAVASGQHGGQTFSIAHLAPYVRVSYEKYYAKFYELYMKRYSDSASEEEIIKWAEEDAWGNTRQEVKDSVQIIQFQENTFNSSNGQTPFVSVFMYLNEEPEYIKETALLIEEMLNLRLLGMKNEYNVYITPSFPKLLYVLDENNVPQDSEYRWLTDLAVKTTAKRMNPDYISAKVMKEHFDGNVFPCMGCRSFLSPWKDENGEYKFYGRFNRGVVTLNLVDVALSAKGDEEKFWNILEERLELCKEALIIKDKMLMKATSDVSPIHWQYGALARLDKGESILPLLRNGYSSISLGYIGVYEMTLVMKGCSHTEDKGKAFALKVMKYLEDKTIAWREIENLHGCSLYGTPSESLCYKFSKTLKKRFGEVCGVTDKDWQTNSYHVCVTEEIDAFSKLSLESKFQQLSKGGAVSYIEVPNMEDNLEALAKVVDYMYDTIQYAEINTRNGDSCGECGFQGEMEIDENGEWYCPQCGCKERSKLTVVRRTCGYIGSTFWNEGKTQEISERVQHL